jgi:hypothetical protein
MRDSLTAAGVPFDYESSNGPGVMNDLWARFQDKGQSASPMYFPVVAVGSELAMRPSPEKVAADYQSAK